MFLFDKIFERNSVANDVSKSSESSKIGIRESFKLFKSKDFDWRSNIKDPHNSGRPLTAYSPCLFTEDYDQRRKIDNPLDEWKVYALPGRPGLTIFYNVFSEEQQLHWLGRAIFRYPEPPSITNLSANGTYSGSEVFDVCGAEKLRWTTLGHHYDWTKKEYRYEEEAEALPPELERIPQLALDVLELGPFWPDAAIVNYYPRNNASLSPHSDRAEIDLTKPLVSLSFGQPAIFLLGGLTPDLPVHALLLRSGDILIMDGQERIAFHAVPRILSGETIFDDPKSELPPELIDYANKCRVNLTVRQVKVKKEKAKPKEDRD